MKNTERFRQLAKDYGLTGQHFYKDSRGFITITRTGIDKIQTKDNINVTYITEKLELDFVVIKAIASSEHGRVESYGEASRKNCKNNFFVAMAQKRSKARAILELTNFYELKVFSEDEPEPEINYKALKINNNSKPKNKPLQFPENLKDK